MAVFFMVVIATVVVYALVAAPAGGFRWHQVLEGKAFLFTALALVAILIGGVAELVPTLAVGSAVPATGAAQRPYTALQLAGREIYVREGCYTCHSQMVRSLAPDTLRYGAVSRAEEFVHDRPFQWGSKRTGPDLHREGGRYPNLWHAQHMLDPRSTSPGSNMPAYAFLQDAKDDLGRLPGLMLAHRKLGTPYTDEEVAGALEAARREGEAIASDLAAQGMSVAADSELVSLIAYLQGLGKTPAEPKPAAAAPEPPATGQEPATGQQPAKADPPGPAAAGQ